jgi:hypothetical protein
MSFQLELPDTCQWFAKCTRPTAYAVMHPVLGYVATCEVCAERIHKQSPSREMLRLTESDGAE